MIEVEDDWRPSGPRTLEQLAAALGVSYRTLMSWRSQGCRIVPGPDGTYSVGEVQAWRLRKPPKKDPRTGRLFGRERRMGKYWP
jgi:hypothetical protein